jgi:hypothetical protein
MTISTDLVNALSASDLCSSYYDLCNDYPSRLDQPKPSISARQVTEVARGRVDIEKLPGPGRVYGLLSLADGIDLNCIIGSQGYVETDVKIESTGERFTFAILCNQIHHLQMGVAPNPPYQRPRCLSADELVAVFIRFAQLSSALPQSTSAK